MFKKLQKLNYFTRDLSKKIFISFCALLTIQRNALTVHVVPLHGAVYFQDFCN